MVQAWGRGWLQADWGKFDPVELLHPGSDRIPNMSAAAIERNSIVLVMVKLYQVVAQLSAISAHGAQHFLVQCR